MTNHHLRAEQVVDWATRGGSKALGMDSLIGSLEEGKKADVVLVKNDALAGHVPGAAPVRPRRLPGAAGRRPHRARQRPRGQAARAGSSASTCGGRARRSTRPSSSRCVRSARRRGRAGCTRRSPRRRSSRTRTSTRNGGRPVSVTICNERVVPDMLAAIHEVLERHQVTEEEWFAALAFLGEVAKADEFILLSDVTRTSVLIDALSHARRRLGGDGERRRGADVHRRAAVPEEDLRGVRGDLARRRRAVRARARDLDDRRRRCPRRSSTSGRPGPAGGYDVWDERQPEGNFRGRIRAEEDGAYEFQTMLPKPYTVPTKGPVGRYLEAVGQHPWRPAHIHFKVTAPGHRTLITQVFFPGRPVPGERHHRRGQAGARAAGRAGERPPHVHVRHRAGPTVSLTFDNLGEVTDLERGEWPADAPLGRARVGHAHAAADAGAARRRRPAGDVLRRGPQRRALPGRAARARRRRARGRVPRLAPRAVGRARPGRRARVARARRRRRSTRSGCGPSASGRRAAS